MLFDFVLVFVSTVVLVRLLARPALTVGLVDHPGGRKRHKGAIPLVGGPAMMGGLVFGALLIVESLYDYRALFAGLAILLIAGLLDDLKDLSPRRKLIAQIAAALFMTSWGGVTVMNLGDLFGAGELLLHDWAVPFTVICVLGLINAVNMTDGMDGLAGGLVLVALCFFAMAALMTMQTALFQLIAVCATVILAFWMLNMRFPWQHRATVFMGDSGSMMLGFLLTWFSVEISRPTNGLPPIVAVWYLAVPLLDMGVVILRRLSKGRSPFSAGRDHLHHILQVAGYRPEEVVYIALAMAIGLAGIATLAWRFGVPEWILFYGFILFVGIGYAASLKAWRLARLLRRLRAR